MKAGIETVDDMDADDVETELDVEKWKQVVVMKIYVL